MPLTDAQLAIRRERISATDVAVILGLNPYKTPADLWLEKTQDIEPLETNEAIEVGNMVESPLIDWCAASLGVQPDRELGTVIHPEHDWLCATPDAGIVGQRRGIEAKSGGIVRGFVEKDRWGEADTADVPVEYWVQVQIQLACLQWDAVWLAALIAGRGRVRYFVPRDNFAIEGFIDVARAWREKYVLGGERPEDSLPDEKTLKRVRRIPNNTIRVADTLVIEFQAAKAAAAAAEARLKAAKEAMLYAATGGDGIVSGVGCYSYLTQSRKGIDVDKLRSDFPEAAEACAKTTTFPVLRPMKGPKGRIA